VFVAVNIAAVPILLAVDAGPFTVRQVPVVIPAINPNLVV
jgi:hypothetical protein